MTVEEALATFCDWLTAQACSAVTIRDRMTMIRAFARFTACGPMTATTAEVLAYLARPDLAAWSRATYYAHLSSWFSYLVARGWREDNPLDAMTPPRAPRSLPRPLTAHEEEQLLGAASTRMRTWLTLGLYAGLRAHEIAKMQGVDITEERIFVKGKGGREDYIPTHPRIWAEALQRPRGFWFPSRCASGHIWPATVSHTSSLFFTSVGVEGAVHRCRHTYATKLLRAGVNIRVVQTLMRHSSLATTQLYTLVDEDERRNAVMLLRGAA